MKKFIFLLLLFPFAALSQVGVNTTNPNAMMDITSTNNGLLIPRVALLSATDNTTVVNPQGGALVTSTLVYNTTPSGVSPDNVVAGFYYWNGTRWVAVGSDGRDWTTTGNSGTNPTNNFIGTTDDVDFRVRTNNNPRFNFTNNGRLRAYDNGVINQPTYSWMGDEDTGMWRPSANTLDLATSGISRIRINNSGNVGINTVGTPARLTVMGNSSNPAIPSTTSNGVLRIGVNANEGLDIGKSDATGNYASWLQSGFLGSTDPLSLQPLGGNVGINTNNPTNSLHVNGTVRIVDGTQANGRVLTSNATGVASWQPLGINSVIGVISSAGLTITPSTTGYFYTGSYITLPPGRFAVNVTMLMARTSLSRSPDDSSFWLRSSFADSPFTLVPSPDIIGSNLISGNHPGSSYYSLLSGTVIINNSTAANKTYYYIAGNVVTFNTTLDINRFGSSYWAEDTIIAYRLN